MISQFIVVTGQVLVGLVIFGLASTWLIWLTAIRDQVPGRATSGPGGASPS
jgi:hypothetical protein